MRQRVRPVVAAALLFSTWTFGALARGAEAAPEGQMVWAFHVTLAPRWLDPAETESVATPFKILYALHDALVKPMPAGPYTPSLAESFTPSKDGLTYEFVIRKGAKFDIAYLLTGPVAEDVRRSPGFKLVSRAVVMAFGTLDDVLREREDLVRAAWRWPAAEEEDDDASAESL